ncbi:AAA family ATPase [Ascidiaceihabitans sp.]|uniref:AAA family ATPase n=1 Tax=Ascidiaceihabitans sp. TaxID=1872644 RepID=UPI0032985E34
MLFNISIPSSEGTTDLALDAGETAIFVGANGGGKTRLSVFIEDRLQANAHRISAHRSLNLNPKVSKIPEDRALGALRYGNTDPRWHNPTQRAGNRWGQKSATHLLNDFDFLIQALFAEQTNTFGLAYHANKPGAEQSDTPFQITKMDNLSEIWERLLPHRRLKISGDDISVVTFDSDQIYDASDMSDGERAIFYMIGQVLVAAENQLLIIDEPELHVHPSIMSKLWDELEAVRPDCAFIYITHDLVFATNRNARKFVIRDYSPTPTWNIEAVPQDTGFSEELTTLILGSRRPILFVEGNGSSLDQAIYRACFPEWTVVPRSSCTEVIHSVVTMRANASLTRVTCTGIVDGDDYRQDDKDRLTELGIQVLPVSEAENLLLLPEVTAAIAEHEGHLGATRDAKLIALADAVFGTLDTDAKIEKVVVDYCKRRIDRALKKVDLSDSVGLTGLKDCYRSATEDIDIDGIASQRTQEIKQSISSRNLPMLLEYYDNKGLVALAATHLKNQHKDKFEEWVVRSLRNNTCPALRDSLKAQLPAITPA